MHGAHIKVVWMDGWDMSMASVYQNMFHMIFTTNLQLHSQQAQKELISAEFLDRYISNFLSLIFHIIAPLISVYSSMQGKGAFYGGLI